MTPEAIVITPLLHGSRAIELGNAMFRKRVLPVGSVEYQGRTLKFSRDYLAGLVSAFKDRAYDFCPIQIADSSNKHTNSPEATRGKIVDMDLSDDGLWITAELGADGEKVLSQYPEMGISARIVENYQRSDGKFYPAALQHALITLDPRVPALGSWQPVEMSNGGGQMIVDLSQASWAGEPGPSFELAASAVLSRLPQADPYDDIDAILAATTPQGYGIPAGLASEFGRAFELSNVTELARQARDAEPLAVRSEDRLANALNRISQGTYVPAGYTGYSLAAQGGTTGMSTCGPADEFGYCRERFHAHGCGSSAAPDVTEALRPAMEQMAARPHLGEDGRAWLDQEFGSPMSLLDHIEASTGIRLGDVGLFETGQARREVAQPQRPAVWGDPDIPGSGQPFPASTRHTAAAFAAQRGIQTTASHQAQQDAYKAQHARLSARIGKPRHQDYAADLSNPVHRETGLAEFGDPPLFGSLQTYSAGAR